MCACGLLISSTKELRFSSCFCWGTVERTLCVYAYGECLFFSLRKLVCVFWHHSFQWPLFMPVSTCVDLVNGHFNLSPVFFSIQTCFYCRKRFFKKKRRIVVFNKKERVASFLYICEMWCKRRVNDHYIEPQFLFCSCILLFKQTLFFLIKVYCFLFFFVFSFFSSKHYRIPIRPQLKNVKKEIVFAILAKCAALFLFFCCCWVYCFPNFDCHFGVSYGHFFSPTWLFSLSIFLIKS